MKAISWSGTLAAITLVSSSALAVELDPILEQQDRIQEQVACAILKAGQRVACPKSRVTGNTDIPKCTVGMPAPEAFELAARWEACAFARAAYSAQCHHPADAGHVAFVHKCQREATKCLVIGGIRGAASEIPGRATCLIGRALTTVVAPLAAAYTAGEAGAAVIEAGGQMYAEHLERSFACSKLPQIIANKNQTCNAAHAARQAFAGEFCPIYFEPLMDDQSRFVGLKEFNPTCNPTLSCGQEDRARELFEEAAITTMNCIANLRLKQMYEAACNGTPWETTPTPTPESSSGGSSSSSETPPPEDLSGGM